MQGKEQTRETVVGARRWALLSAGSLALALGVVGVVVPILPTTPFLIVAAFCYARSSPRGHKWLTSNRLFGRYLSEYLECARLPWMIRVRALIFLWVVLALTAFLVVDGLAVRLVLLAVGGGVTLHLLTLKGARGHGDRAERIVGGIIGVVAYALALALAVGVVHVTGLTHPLAQIGLGTVVATLVVFGASLLSDNSSLYDPYWSVQPLAIVGYYLVRLFDAPTARTVLVSLLVFLYAVRLTSNFYRGWPGLAHEDFRYRAFRTRFGRAYWPVSLFGIHLFPTLMVYLGCLPLYGVMSGGSGGLTWLDAVGTLVMLGAIVLAFVSDEQLRVFRRDPMNRGKSIATGLWAHSRHPNYLGEIATWWGLLLFALAAGMEWWWTGVGAMTITLMFCFVSVPMMEKRALVTREGYREYRRQTPMLMPVLRRVPTTARDGAGLGDGD